MRAPTDIGEDGQRIEATPEMEAIGVLDTVHLERQVFGDVELRGELLRLYAERLTALAPVVCGVASLDRREAAHALRGASLAIGAFALARVCEGMEGPEGEDTCDEAAIMIETTLRRVTELLGLSD